MVFQIDTQEDTGFSAYLQLYVVIINNRFILSTYTAPSELTQLVLINELQKDQRVSQSIIVLSGGCMSHVHDVFLQKSVSRAKLGVFN